VGVAAAVEAERPDRRQRLHPEPHRPRLLVAKPEVEAAVGVEAAVEAAVAERRDRRQRLRPEPHRPRLLVAKPEVEAAVGVAVEVAVEAAVRQDRARELHQRRRLPAGFEAEPASQAKTPPGPAPRAEMKRPCPKSQRPKQLPSRHRTE
jgi:hypothetical protein